jgi:thymidylate synthase (FAD)
MKIIKPSFEILSPFPINTMEIIEDVARTCYQSHEKTKEGSAQKLFNNLLTNKHLAMLEFVDMTVRFVTDRGVSHELVRHRLCSFAQESTRYCNYKDKHLEFIPPIFHEQDLFIEWIKHMGQCEIAYNKLIKCGAQIARSVLPNSLKTSIVMKANLREWIHIFELRTSASAHPNMRELMIPLCMRTLMPHIVECNTDDVGPITQQRVVMDQWAELYGI